MMSWTRPLGILIKGTQGERSNQVNSNEYILLKGIYITYIFSNCNVFENKCIYITSIENEDGQL